MFVTSQNNQVDIQPVSFQQYRSDRCAFNQQRGGINIPIAQTLGEMLQKLMFMAKLASNFPAHGSGIHIKGRLVRMRDNVEKPHLARKGACQFKGSLHQGGFDRYGLATIDYHKYIFHSPLLLCQQADNCTAFRVDCSTHPATSRVVSPVNEHQQIVYLLRNAQAPEQ
jgi:hypothetical protein